MARSKPGELSPNEREQNWGMSDKCIEMASLYNPMRGAVGTEMGIYQVYSIVSYNAKQLLALPQDLSVRVT